MNSINDILDQIGDFQCMISGKTISITGILNKSNGVVLLHGNIVHKGKIKEIDDNTPLHIWGNVNSTPVTLLNGYIKSTIWNSLNVDSLSIVINPYEIIIGSSYSNCSNEIKVTQISASITALNYMFASKPLEHSFCIPQINSAVLNYTYHKPIIANDKFGKIQIYQTFNQKWSTNTITHNIIPVIEYTFKEPMVITEAVARIAAARNLFSFFANYYLPLENIKFSDKRNENEESPVLCEFTLYLNHDDNTIIPKERFLIMTDVFEDIFQSIWEKWLDVYEKAEPIFILFYEIICDRSTGINRFLNLSQAIEVYSCRYRESDANNIKSKNKDTKIYLKHRIEDILVMLNFSLNLNNDDIESVAHALADIRNYFTHYNINHIKPTYEEVLAAGYILRFVLLGIIYNLLGIDSKYINNCRKRSYFGNLDICFKTVLDYRNKKIKLEL